MRPRSRPVVFLLVGALGLVCQLAVLHSLTAAGIPVAPAAAVAVAAAVAHNFFWHRRWTWADRQAHPREGVVRQFARFAGLNGVVSLAGNVAITAGLVQAGVSVLAANIAAVGVCALANFVLADRLVFVTAALALLAVPPAATAAAELTPATLAAWEAYVRATEQRIRIEEPRAGVTPLGAEEWRRLRAGEPLLMRRETRRADGATFDVPGGAVHHWVGRVFLPRVSLAALLRELQAPTSSRWTPTEVRSMRVAPGDAGGLRVAMRVERQSLVDVTYDIEHHVRYTMQPAGHATSRSIARRIVELAAAGTPQERALPEGRDQGFLWKLNAYWRYTPVDGGVLVECESLALSRGVPLVLRAVAWPLVDRVSRESLFDTLTALRRGFGDAPLIGAAQGRSNTR
jgi:putative flippase GtrA